MQQRLKIWTPPILWATLIFAVSSIPSLQVTEDTLLQHIINNVGHFTEYFILAFLLFRSFKQQNLSLSRIPHLTFYSSLLYSLSDEFHQYFVPGRMSDPLDILVDTLGIIGAIWWLTSHKSKKQKN